ncbi:MAG: acetyl-CoA synthase subunit gamma [Deltaproteobacteria bacterium]|nr:acetyl-CoA synthase subunit gamma [Deltaproteobacteria bacterium]
MGRMTYLVPPGLYAIGAPDAASPVMVTANYKMTYDIVRESLAGRSVWLLVLETFGINVWCAAGKGTFGTGELVRRVEQTGLAGIVAHRRLILPLVGAAGVKALEVRQRTGFSVCFATLRAADLPAYLDAGMTASAGMRALTFTLYERLVLTPVEIVGSLKKSLLPLLLIFIAAAVSAAGFNPAAGFAASAIYLAALLSGTFLAPLLLPWLPTRSFAVKGAAAGLLVALAIIFATGLTSRAALAAVLLLVPAVSSFFMLNFTGSTPFTSKSGVRKEMRWALPFQGAALLAGVVTALAGRFL